MSPLMSSRTATSKGQEELQKLGAANFMMQVISQEVKRGSRHVDSLTFDHRFDNDKVMVIFTNSMELRWPQPMNTPGRVTWEGVFHNWKCSVCHLFHCRNRVSSPPNPGKWCRASAA